MIIRRHNFYNALSLLLNLIHICLWFCYYIGWLKLNVKYGIYLIHWYNTLYCSLPHVPHIVDNWMVISGSFSITQNAHHFWYLCGNTHCFTAVLSTWNISVVAALWGIWLARNNCYFSRVGHHPEATISQVWFPIFYHTGFATTDN